jgi:hypothetical protein
MGNRLFLIIVLAALVLVGAAVYMHSPAGAGMRRAMRGALHGGG